MLSFFSFRPLIEQSSADWIYSVYEWALVNFDSNEFYQRSQLVQPTNQYFPGRVDSVHAKATTVFEQTQLYAGLNHWPFKLIEPEKFQSQSANQLDRLESLRNSQDPLPSTDFADLHFELSYNPYQTMKPEDLSSSFAHLFAQHLVLQSKQLPPNGAEYFVEATEVLAIFMGFGVMFANSAYTFRGGCGSCNNPNSNRQAALSEPNVLFALALFCRLKGIPKSEATRHLKKHLIADYKRALRQIERDSQQLERLLRYRDYSIANAK